MLLQADSAASAPARDDLRPVASVAFADFPGPFNPDRILRLLRRRIAVRLDTAQPDYVIYSVFGSAHLRHPDAVRIFFTGENVRPDFNVCDYAFGYDRLAFGDRYHRCPNYLLYEHFDVLRRTRRTDLAALPPDRRFCNFVYTNGGGHPLRDRFFRALGEYRFVHSAGAHLRNCDDDVGRAYDGDWCTPKVEYQRGFKFTIAFENSSTPGYTTEKLVHALAAGTIPIYWGDPDVARDFNSRRIVNCHEFSSLDEVVARVRAIDADEALYRSMLAEPFFPDDRIPPDLEDEPLLEALDAIFQQPKASAFRRNGHGWGARYERERRVAADAVAFLNSPGLLPRAARILFRSWRRRQPRPSSVSHAR